jgi:hypothetical protein
VAENREKSHPQRNLLGLLDGKKTGWCKTFDKFAAMEGTKLGAW